MGTLANSLFQVMLDWIRALSSQVWATASSPDSSTLLKWLGVHWKISALLLCLAGTLIDLMVYMFRWQPWRVWRSFFSRMRSKEVENPEPVKTPEYRPEDDFAKARSQDESERDRREENQGYQIYNKERGTGEPESIREFGADFFEEDVNEPIPEDTASENRENRLVWSRTEPEGTTADFEQAILPRRRRRVRGLFSEAQMEDTPAPEELIDRYAAYRRPVYPRSWKAEEGDEENP